jgi:Mn-dependent DtxR family transcriptional regulator
MNAKTRTFLEQVASGKMDNLRMKLYFLVEQRPNLNAKSYATLLEIKYATAVGRLSELNDMGVITQDDNGRYSVTPPHLIEAVARQRAEAKYLRWQREGVDNGWFYDSTKSAEKALNEMFGDIEGQLKMF